MSDTTIHSSSNLSRLSQTEAQVSLKRVGPQPTNTSKVYQGNDSSQEIKADQASLSTASGLIGKALSVSDVRAEKVAGLQKAIGDGTYHVSSAKVADKLLQSLLGE